MKDNENSGNQKFTIWIDADACPVKDIIVSETTTFDGLVYFVSSFAHYSTKSYPDHIRTTFIEGGPDAVDYYLLSKVQPCDLLITQDYGLAALALNKKATVLHHTGFFYTEQNIGLLLEKRHQHQRLRKAGGRHKGPKKLTTETKEKFRKVLKQYLYQRISTEGGI